MSTIHPNTMEWTKKRISLLIFSSLFHLSLSLLQFETIDWLSEYYSAIEIIEGIPFYEQRTTYVNGRAIWYPNHFPLFFYALAMVLEINQSQVIGRVFLWMYSILLYLLFIEIVNPKEDQQYYFFHFIYFLNPIIILILILGLFDLFLMLYFLGGIYLIQEEYYFLGSIFLIIATFTKYIAIIAILYYGLKLLLKLEWKNFLILTITYFSAVLTIIHYLWTEYGPLFERKIFYFHIERSHPSLSPLYYIDLNIEPRSLFFIQLSLMLGFGLVITILSVYYKLDDYLVLSALISLFILGLRTIYAHYGIWFQLFLLIYLSRVYFTDKSLRTYDFWLIVVSVLFSGLGILGCSFSCFDSANPILLFVYTEVILHFIGNLIPIIVVSYNLISINQT